MRGVIYFGIILFCVSVASAATCQDSVSECFDASLDSELGYGAVEICGDCYVCGVDDGVCPETFSDGESYASCSQCPDPDCLVSLSGYVSVADNPQQRIEGAAIQATIGDREYSALSDEWGYYSLELPRGAYRLSVSKYAYDTSLVGFPLNQGADLAAYTLNVSLQNGSCHADCTGFAYEGQTPLCKASCAGFSNGLESCAFATNTTDENFFDAAVLCDGKPIGSRQIAFVEGDRTLVVECCTGEFFWQPRPAPKFSEDVSLQNLIAKTLVAKLNGDLVRLRVLVYD